MQAVRGAAPGCVVVGPQHPRGEGYVIAFFLVAVTGYAMLMIYVFSRLAVGT